MNKPHKPEEENSKTNVEDVGFHILLSGVTHFAKNGEHEK